MERPINTAWDACGDWWWTDGYALRIKGGRRLYGEATASQTNQSVKLSSLEGLSTGIHQIVRYVHPDTPVELVVKRAGKD